MNPADLIDGEWRRQAGEWQRSLVVIEALLENLVTDYERHKDQLVIGVLFIKAQCGTLREEDKRFMQKHHLESIVVQLQKAVRTA